MGASIHIAIRQLLRRMSLKCIRAPKLLRNLNGCAAPCREQHKSSLEPLSIGHHPVVHAVRPQARCPASGAPLRRMCCPTCATFSCPATTSGATSTAVCRTVWATGTGTKTRAHGFCACPAACVLDGVRAVGYHVVRQVRGARREGCGQRAQCAVPPIPAEDHGTQPSGARHSCQPRCTA